MKRRAKDTFTQTGETALSTPKIFADPTLDQTFKMIFKEENKDLLINFLNNLLNFRDENLISDLDVIDSSIQKIDISTVKSVVDVRCRTIEGREIAVEMQRSNKPYFLPRTQDYMAKMMAGQVQDGESSQYHTKMRDTYILVIAVKDLFIGKYKFKNLREDNDDQYEKTVVPYVLETGEEVPGNKMYWKFFEIQRFEKYRGNLNEEALSSLKVQWLDFFINCSKMEKIPENVDDVIKKGYQIMDMANWSADDRERYWRIKSIEVAEREEREREREEREREREEREREREERKREKKSQKIEVN